MTRWQRFLWRHWFNGYAHISNAEEFLTCPRRRKGVEW